MKAPLLPRPLMVGVSGGADSVYLFHQLIAGGGEGLIICHLNHGLRGEEADLDQALVHSLTEEHGCLFEQKKIDLPTIMKDQGETSMETVARAERFKFFQEVGRKHNTFHIALAHHADDQAETALMNLCRGSAGLKGISSPSEMSEYGLTLWRPLLHLRKAEIITSLQQRELPWREDASNQQAIATRNRVRNEVLPLLNEVFQRDVTTSIIKALGGKHSSIPSEILEALNVYDPQGRLYLPTLQTFSPALQSYILHTYLKENGISDLTEEKITECLKLLEQEEVWKVNLPGDQFLRRKEKRLFIEVNG